MTVLYTKIAVGTKTVTTAGQGVQMPSVVVPNNGFLTIRALPTNTGNIYLSDSLTNVGIAANRLTLTQAEGVDLQIVNANMIWIGATVSGEGVEYITESD